MIRPINTQSSSRSSSGFRLLYLSGSIVAGICVLALVLPREHDHFSLSVKYFFPKQSHLKAASLKSDAVVPWGYSQDNGPEHWGDLSLTYRKCQTGAAQSPIDVKSADIKSQLLTLPRLRWNGFENSSSVGQESFIKGDLGSHGYRIQFVERAPTITTVDFTQYLNIIPISKAKSTTYSLDRVLFKTPSEHLINGKRRVPLRRLSIPSPAPLPHAAACRAAGTRARCSSCTSAHPALSPPALPPPTWSAPPHPTQPPRAERDAVPWKRATAG
jgi:hypothetical protein